MMAETVGFFTRHDLSKGPTKAAKKAPSSDFDNVHHLHRMECRACPLNKADMCSPKMKPRGSKEPVIYVLGTSPTYREDEAGKHGIGKPNQLLKNAMPTGYDVRFNNVIRCFPGERDPEWNEIECCRPSIEKDIEETQPEVIIGVGGPALKWALKQGAMVSKWRGRRFPIQIGKHKTWFYPINHPEYVLRVRDGQTMVDEIRIPGSEIEKDFENDISAIFEELGDLPEPDPEDLTQLDRNVTILRGSEEDLDYIRDTFAEWIEDGDPIAIDIETSHLRPYEKDPKVLTMSFGKYTDTIVFPFDHSESAWTEEQKDKLLDLIEQFFLAEKNEFIAQNLTFEMEWFLWLLGEEIMHKTIWQDTMLAAYVIDSRRHTHSLAFLTLLNFGFDLKKTTEVDHANLTDEKLSDLLVYNGRDTKYEQKLWLKQLEYFENEPTLYAAYVEQVKRAPTLVKAQEAGLCVDQDIANEFDKSCAKDVETAKKEIARDPDVVDYVKKYGAFNPLADSKDVKIFFRDHLKRKEGRKANNKYTTDAKALEKMKDVPVAAKILDLRTKTKLRSTYIAPLLPHTDNSVLFPDGKLHTSFNQTFTLTGRLSSSDPNAQNFPKRKNKWVRKMVIAPDGHVILSVDYGQIEARVIGMASKDPVFCEALWKDYDIHMHWAEKIAAADPRVLKTRNDSMKEFRSDVKNQWTFPAFYGSQPSPIASAVGIDENLCKELFEEFWDDHKDVKKWQQGLARFYKKHRYVETMTGRRRYSPMNPNMIINTPIQGTASDIVVDAMRRLCLEAYESGISYIQPVLNIHDDLTFYIPKKKLDYAMDIIIPLMCDVPYDFVNVPISVEAEVGENWYEMKEAGTYRSDEFNDAA